MIWLSLFITFVVGFSLLTACSTKFSYLEKLGASFLLGIGIQVLWMLLFDFAGIRISLPAIYVSSFLSIGACFSYTFILRKNTLKEVFWPYNPFLGKEWNKVNFPWVALMLFIGYMFWAITIKCLFWPTFEFDSVAGYDLISKVVAAEGTFHNSLFMSNGQAMFNTASRLVYPPLVPGSFAYAYLSGAALSKIITSCYYTSFLFLIYGLMRRVGLTHLNVAFIVLLVMLIPEMTSHAALSQTNMPQGVYTSTAFIALYLWFNNKEDNAHYFYLSMFLFACNSMVRSENIIFGFVAGLALLFYTIKQRNKKNIIRLVLFGTAILTPFILWTLFMKINGMKPDAPAELSLSLAYNAQKYTDWWGLLWGYDKYPEGIVMNKGFYGLTPHLYFFLLLLSSAVLGLRYYLTSKATRLADTSKTYIQHLNLVYFTLVPFLLYSLFYYFVEYDWDTIRNVMLYSYKRGLFGDMVLFCFFIGANALTKQGFDAIGQFLYGKEGKKLEMDSNI